MHQQVRQTIRWLLNELEVNKDEMNHSSKVGKADLCNFYEKIGFMVNPKLDYKFAPSKDLCSAFLNLLMQ